MKKAAQKILTLTLAMLVLAGMLPVAAADSVIHQGDGYSIKVTEIPKSNEWNTVASMWGSFNDGLLQVEYNLNDGGLIAYGPKGWIDKNCELVIPMTWRSQGDIFNHHDYHDGLSVASLDGKSGYVDKTGKTVIPFQYDEAYAFSEGLARVAIETGEKINGGTSVSKIGFIDTQGNVVIPFEYTSGGNFSDGMVWVGRHIADSYGYIISEFAQIDKTGKIIVPFGMGRTVDFHEGLAAYDAKSYIDKTGKIVQSKHYASTSGFHEGLAAVTIVPYPNIQMGYVDKADNIIIPAQFKDARPFGDGLAAVSNQDGKWGMIDRTGKVIVPFEYYSIGTFNGEPIVASKWIEGTKPADYDYFILEKIPSTTTPPSNPPAAEAPSSWAAAEVNAAIAARLVPQSLQQNYTQPISRGAVAQMLINLVEQTTGQGIDDYLAAKGITINSNAFTDTTNKAVLAANALGLINGVGNGRFDAEGTLTRAQIAAIANRYTIMLGVDVAGYSHSFTDVSGHWVSAELGWPVHAGIIQGVGNNQFNPDGALTVEQAIAITSRVLKAEKPNVPVPQLPTQLTSAAAAYDALSSGYKSLLDELESAMLAVLNEYQAGSFEKDAATGLSAIKRKIFDLQNTSRYQTLVDGLYRTNGNEPLWFSSQSGVVYSVFRLGSSNEATYHFDLYKGSGGVGYFLGSRGDTTDYSTLHIVPYSGGSANGTAHYYVYPNTPLGEAFVQRFQIQNGAAYGTSRVTTESGSSYEDNSTVAEQNWFPAWPEDLR